MSITITVANLDTMPPEGVRRVAGLFQVIADYQNGLVNNEPFPKLDMDVPEQSAEPDIDATIAHTVTKTASGIEVDAQGLPWDGRIHASSRAKVVDGTWRLRRGVDDQIVTAVKRELQIAMGAPTIAPAPEFVMSAPVVESDDMTQFFKEPEVPLPIVPPPPFVNTVVPPVTSVDISHLQEVGAAQTVSHTSPAQTVSHTSPALTFMKLMQLITAKYQAKELDQAMIQAAITKVGLPSLPMLGSRPDLVQSVADELGILA